MFDYPNTTNAQVVIKAIELELPLPEGIPNSPEILMRMSLSDFIRACNSLNQDTMRNLQERIFKREIKRWT